MNNLDVTGRIHSFESFGAVDGPGIRFIIFTQGCNLKCKYCQNRDTWDVSTGETYTVKQLLDKIENYKEYMQVSGGGVTVSGGEPLLQPDFLIALFTELHKAGISTCIDTAGIIPLTDRIKQVIELTDIFLLDIKSINDNTCTWLTGFSNKLELEFAKYLSDNNKRICIRHVLVPGITDKDEDLLNLRDFISNLQIEKVEFLPYHTLGKFKWEKLGLKYELDNIRPANTRDVAHAKKMVIGDIS